MCAYAEILQYHFFHYKATSNSLSLPHHNVDVLILICICLSIQYSGLDCAVKKMYMRAKEARQGQDL